LPEASVLGVCTPTTSAKLARHITPQKLLQSTGFDITMGEAKELMSQVPVDEDGYPTIFGSVLKGDGDFEISTHSMECDDSMKLEEDVANGVAPPIKQRLKGKQAVKKKILKATMIQPWHPDDPHAAEASKGQKAKEEDPKGKGQKSKRANGKKRQRANMQK
jgi:hypothetical protein